MTQKGNRKLHRSISRRHRQISQTINASTVKSTKRKRTIYTNIKNLSCHDWGYLESKLHKTIKSSIKTARSCHEFILRALTTVVRQQLHFLSVNFPNKLESSSVVKILSAYQISTLTLLVTSPTFLRTNVCSSLCPWFLKHCLFYYYYYSHYKLLLWFAETLYAHDIIINPYTHPSSVFSSSTISLSKTAINRHPTIQK